MRTYPALTVMAWVYRGLAVLFFLFGALVAALTVGDGALMLGLGTVAVLSVVSVSIYAIGELIVLLIHMAQDNHITMEANRQTYQLTKRELDMRPSVKPVIKKLNLERAVNE